MNEALVEKRSVASFLWKKKKTNKQIYQEMSEVYAEDMQSIKTIQKWTKKMIDGDWSIFDRPREGRPERAELSEKIQEVLAYNPYASTKKIAKKVGADPKTVKKVLIEKLQMRKVNFKWIPYTLTLELKAKRVEIAKDLFDFLSNCNDQKLRKVLTQDETWVYFSNPRNSMWLEEGQPIPEKPKKTIGAKKVMISVIWGITGIISITMLPIDQKFNRNFFEQKVLGDLSSTIKTNGFFLHMDNARPHLVHEKLKELGIKRLEHPPYSPDLAPSDFFLFGYLKKLLEGEEFDSEIELFDRVTEILKEISKSVLKSVYDEWMNRLLIVQESKGNYVH